MRKAIAVLLVTAMSASAQTYNVRPIGAGSYSVTEQPDLGKSIRDLGEAYEGYKARKESRKTAMGYLTNAQELLEKGKAERAEAACERSLAVLPTAEAFRMRAECRIAQGLEKSATDDLRHAHDLNRKDIRTRALLAAVLARSGQRAEAMEILAQLAHCESNAAELEAIEYAREELNPASAN